MANLLWWISVASVLIATGTAQGHYYGKSLGKLSELHHGVSGHVYAVDGRTLFIKDFTYDGEGPAAYFYVGSGKSPSNAGAMRVRDERGSAGVLRRYRGKDITLTLPEGKTFNSIKWFSVWCDEFSVNFGDVKIPRNLDYPKPQKISGLSGVHAVSSDPIVLVDAQTLLIPNFSYDGEAPDAKFWAGRGDKPSPQGIRIPDENGKEIPLIRYDRKTIVLTLPGDLTVFDIGHFGVWCEAFTVDFGHVKLPELPNIPPSLKMLGVSPQKRNQELLSSTSPVGHTSSSSNKFQIQGNLKATTYRPPTARFLNSAVSSLEPSSGRFQAPLNVNDANFQLVYPVAPSAIHRRADDFQSPQAQQLAGNVYNNYNRQSEFAQKGDQRGDKSFIQPSREIYVNHEPPQDSRTFYNQYPQIQYLQQQLYQQQQAQLLGRPQYIAQQPAPQLLQNQPQYQRQFQQQSQSPVNYQQFPVYQNQLANSQNQLANSQYQDQSRSFNVLPVGLERRRYDLDLGRGFQNGGSNDRFSFSSAGANTNAYARFS